MSTLRRIAIVGGGKRAITLGKALLAERDRGVLVAIAEPRPDRVEDCRRIFGVSDVQYYRDHKELLSRCPGVDGVIVATSVPTHADVTCDCLDRRAPVYLEKPISNSVESARRIVEAARRTGTPVFVGFNLRYAPFFEKLHEIVSSGQIGRVLAINWTEGIPARMWGDDYCRSPSYNRRSAIGSLLLEKSCHDVDQINWLLGVRCARVASFGSRGHFLPRPDLPERCSPECPEHAQCFFYSPTPERRGRLLPEDSTLCVYHCGSDLVDRQTAILEYENGVVANLNVAVGWTPPGRFLAVCGTTASLTASSGENRISVRELRSDIETVYHPTVTEAGHGGADERCVRGFLECLSDPAESPRAMIADGFESVLMGCAIDTALREHRVVELAPLRGNAAEVGDDK